MSPHSGRASRHSDRESRRRIDDRTAEELLTSHEPPPPELAQVSAVLAALRETTQQPPPRPNEELARRMAEADFPPVPAADSAGDGADAGATGSTAVPDRPRAVAGVSLRRLAAWGPRLAIVCCAALLLAGVLAAGFTRSLPQPAQARFETVVESVTGFELGAGKPANGPDGGDAPAGEAPAGDTTDGDTTGDSDGVPAGDPHPPEGGPSRAPPPAGVPSSVPVPGVDPPGPPSEGAPAGPGAGPGSAEDPPEDLPEQPPEHPGPPGHPGPGHPGPGHQGPGRDGVHPREHGSSRGNGIP